MCGICGIVKKNKISDQDRLLIREMNTAIAHRGPDDEGYFEAEKICLGHRRLSIIDVSSAGHQPMSYAERYKIVFNGEIYNYLELKEQLLEQGYKFETCTDTEVIMASYDHWGIDCLNKFNGMWAFALIDTREKTLLLSRDRFGVKPLYYHIDQDGLIFASEIKAIVKDKSIKRRANDKVVYDYLSQGLIDHTNETFFEGIYQFPKSSYVLISLDEIDFHPRKYWNLDFNCKIEGKTNKEDCEKFKNFFMNSIKFRLRSDVPIGSCLSGGLDSSAIVCAIDSLKKSDNQKQYTFSYRADDSKLDEYKYMKAVIDETNVEPVFVSPKSDDLMKEIDDLIYFQDEPFSTTGMYAGYCVYRQAGEKKVKVLLDGQGADEFLCGYRKSRVYYVKRLIKNYKLITAVKEFILSVSQIKTSLVFNSNKKSDINKLLRILGLNKEKNNVLSRYYNEEFLNSTEGIGYDRTKDFQYNDVFNISLPSLLRYTDRNSMAFSVESRLPFLDYEFAEYCAGLSISKKLENGYSKSIMRKSLKLPKLIKERKDKLGFVTPEDEWIIESSKTIRQAFENKNFRSKRYINRETILADWDEVVSGKIPYFFRMYCLEKWMQIFNVE